jgi:hypothetical protein
VIEKFNILAKTSKIEKLELIDVNLNFKRPVFQCQDKVNLPATMLQPRMKLGIA